MRTLRIRTGRYARAFAMPTNMHQKIAMFLKGWRPDTVSVSALPWWTKPSPNLRRRLAEAE